MRDHVSLHINGQPVEVRGEDAFITLSDLLRKRERLPGTKVVCAEGDCGSCTVLVGRTASAGVKYVAVCSCIQLVHQLDGAHVVTVEGLKDGDELNPLQQSMVACGGAQCGFCTPGFVVALQQLLDDRSTPCTPDRIKRGLVGNLCRCTGYDAIVRAACATDRSTLRSLDERYPIDLPDHSPLTIDAGGRRVFKPTTLGDAVAYRAANPTCTVVSGATDVGVLFNKRVRDVPNALQLGGVTELRAITVEGDAIHGGWIHVGATATLGELEAVALEHLDEFGRFLSWFGSPQIKAAGTLAGNVATGSPIGDTLPTLHVMNAEIELVGPRGRRRVNVNDYYTGYRQSVIAPDELIAAVHVPLLASDETLKIYKVSKRQDLDISSFSAAIWIKRTGDVIDDVRIAFGGVGPTVLRCQKIEKHLRGQTMTQELFAHSAAIAWREITPISDVRGSKEYRCTLAANILRKAYFDLVDGYQVAASGVKDDRAAGATPGANAFDGSIYGKSGGDGNGKAR